DEELGHGVTDLYRRSVLTARTHVDNRGAVIASTDFDITKFARDTYAYAWPRDGALVANALDHAGHEDVTREFFQFCQQTLVGEEGWGVHAFTVGAVWAGLDAARGFADLFGDLRAYGRYRDAAERMREASDTNLYSEELDRFPRRITAEDDESVTVDTVLDSAIYGLWRFGMYPPNDRRIVNTMKAIAEQLANKANCGGIARYMDDYYFKVEPDTTKTPGNPWFMCTMWLAEWYIVTAKSAADV